MSQSPDPGQYDQSDGGQPPPPGYPAPWVTATLAAGDFAVAFRRDGEITRVDTVEEVIEVYESGETPGVVLYRPHHVFVSRESINPEDLTVTLGDEVIRLASAEPVCDLVDVLYAELADEEDDPLDLFHHPANTVENRNQPPIGLVHGYRRWSHVGWFSHVGWMTTTGPKQPTPDFENPPPAGIKPKGFPKAPANVPATQTIGLIDTGVDDKHTWIAGHFDGDKEAGNTEHDAHGTMVAGVLRQGAPGSDVYSKRIVVSNNTVEENAIIHALGDLNDDGCKMVVMSFGGEQVGSFSNLETAIKNFEKDGGTVVAAAGNLHPDDGAENFDVAPAMYTSVIAVAGGPTAQHYPDGNPSSKPSDYYPWSNGGTWVNYIVEVDNSEGFIYSSYPATPKPGEPDQPGGWTDRFAAGQGTSLLAPLIAAQIVSGSAQNAHQEGLV